MSKCNKCKDQNNADNGFKFPFSIEKLCQFKDFEQILDFEIMKVYDNVSVSYTHLDVYKRQLLMVVV